MQGGPMRHGNRSRCNVICAGTLIAAIFGWCGGAVRGQQPADGAGASATSADDAWRRRMEERMGGLERENAELRKEVGRVGETREAVAADAREKSGVAGFTLSPRGVTTPPDFDIRKYAAEGTFPGSIS